MTIILLADPSVRCGPGPEGVPFAESWKFSPMERGVVRRQLRLFP